MKVVHAQPDTSSKPQHSDSDLPDCVKDWMRGRGGGLCDDEPMPPPAPRVTNIVLGPDDYTVDDVEVKGHLTLQV